MSKQLHWLAPRRQSAVPVTFGVPHMKGTLQREEPLQLKDQDGNSVPVQSKVTAYWPDGSVKWTAHSAVLEKSKSYQVEKGAPAADAHPLCASQDALGNVTVESQLLYCRIETGTQQLIAKLLRKNTQHGPMSARLVGYMERSQMERGMETHSLYRFVGMTQKVTLEEAGPVRAVVKIEGNHVYDMNKAQVLPFVVRLYFYAQSDEVKLVHSFVYNMNEQTDLLKGLAVEFSMETGGELYNRHVGFVGESGMFYESVQPMYVGGGIWGRKNTKRAESGDERLTLYQRQQIDGQFVQLDPEEMPEFCEVVEDNAAFGDYRMNQPSCDNYVITKRTHPSCAYITAAQGTRSGGTIFVGTKSGIVAAGIKDCWQKAPMALEVEGLTGDRGVMTLWLWSRYAQAMDFRAYDNESHAYSYGGVMNVPEGIANTNEIYLKLFDQMPGKQAILDFSHDIQTDSLLVADAETYGNTGVFGSYWIQPKEEKYRNAAYEKALVEYVRFYIREVEQRRWYGFWDYGDVMHTYDPIRHCWRYDVGGYAWQNTELCNTYVNWLTFLRTGDYEIYRFARAMSRHASEVDTYHLGKFAMLGTRHNVRHWGCGAKEPRISMAGHHRFFYYLTADERMGDVMDFVKDVDNRCDYKDPMGGFFPPKHTEENRNYAHVRVGPDWTSYAVNWLTRWERFEDTAYRDKLLRGIESLKKAPLRLSSGSTFHYDHHDGILHYMGAENPAGHTHLGDGNYQQHMVVCFGGPETWMELCDLTGDEEMRDMLAQFGELYAMTPQQRKEATGGRINETNDRPWAGHGEVWGIRTYAYAAWLHHRADLMEKAEENLRYDGDLEDVTGDGTQGRILADGTLNITQVARKDTPRPMQELKYAKTNGISQWSLNYMETARLKEMMGEKEEGGNR